MSLVHVRSLCALTFTLWEWDRTPHFSWFPWKTRFTSRSVAYQTCAHSQRAFTYSWCFPLSCLLEHSWNHAPIVGIREVRGVHSVSDIWLLQSIISYENLLQSIILVSRYVDQNQLLLLSWSLTLCQEALIPFLRSV